MGDVRGLVWWVKNITSTLWQHEYGSFFVFFIYKINYTTIEKHLKTFTTK